MRHRKSSITSRLGKRKGHRELMLRNLLTSLFLNDKLRTTETKGKIVRTEAEKLITKIKRNDKVNAIREAKKVLFTVPASKKAIDLAENYKEKSSGYTRLTNVGIREGDAAKMVLIEFVENTK